MVADGQAPLYVSSLTLLCPHPSRLTPRATFLRSMDSPGLAECLIKEPYEFVVASCPLVRQYYMDPVRELFPKTPLHVLARHQTILSSIDFLGVAAKEKIDEKRGRMRVSGIFREPDAARVLDEQRIGNNIVHRSAPLFEIFQLVMQGIDQDIKLPRNHLLHEQGAALLDPKVLRC